jgi:hypothetical protein
MNATRLIQVSFLIFFDVYSALGRKSSAEDGYRFDRREYAQSLRGSSSLEDTGSDRCRDRPPAIYASWDILSLRGAFGPNCPTRPSCMQWEHGDETLNDQDRQLRELVRRHAAVPLPQALKRGTDRIARASCHESNQPLASWSHSPLVSKISGHRHSW